MLFSSIPFLYYFLPAVLILYFLVPTKLKNAVLLLSSLVFYGWGEPKYVILMALTIGAFYLCGLAIGSAKSQPARKLWLAAAVFIGIVFLVIFKYADFFLQSFASVTGLSLPLLKLALPIGISFYTFQCMSYAVDVYRGVAQPQKNPISFGAYVALFPQLIAGPIVRYVDVARELENRTTTFDDAMAGIRRFLVGLGKKILIANQLGLLTEVFRDSGEKSILFHWMYAVAFMLHIYFDFSGYSDMAIGLGRVFGFHFIENFDYPYLSKSVTEFWRRWHMSLGSWFRDYVYIPLGGNRVMRARWVFNILVVWMLTGLWHGASWNFVLWGLLFAVVLLIEKWLPALWKLPSFVRHSYVLLIVMASFVLFNAADLPQAAQDLKGLVAGLPVVTQESLYYLRSYAVVFLVSIVGATPLPKLLAAKLPEKAMAVVEPVLLIVLLLTCTAYLVDGSFNPFLYFRF